MASAESVSSVCRCTYSVYLYESIAHLAADCGLLSEARFWYRQGTNLGQPGQLGGLWNSWGDTEFKLVGAAYLCGVWHCLRACERSVQDTHSHAGLHSCDCATVEAHRYRRSHKLARACARAGTCSIAMLLMYPARLAFVRDRTSQRTIAILCAGDERMAKFCFEQALKAQPRNRYAYLSWATLEKALGNYEECARLLREGILKNPTDSALPQVWAP